MSPLLKIITENKGALQRVLVRAFLALLLILLFLVSFGGVSQQDRWKIEHVEVTGEHAVDEEAILSVVKPLISGNYYYTYARENSYLFPREEIEQALLTAFPRLKTARASRIDDHMVEISVTERAPYALWCGEVYLREMYEINDCYFIDDTGFLFDRAPAFSEGVYLEVYGELVGKSADGAFLRAHLSSHRFALMRSVLEGLTQSVGEVLRIVAKTEGEYEVVIKSSATYPILAHTHIRFKEDANPVKLVRDLSSALAVQFPGGGPTLLAKAEGPRTLYYIDMRFGNKIFFGFEQDGE